MHKEIFLKSHAEYGACFPKNPEYSEVEYVVGVEIKDEHNIPKDYHVCTIPEALYVVFTPPPADAGNLSSSIQGTYEYIFSEWFPNSEYEFMENGVDFQLFDEDNLGKTGKFFMSIHIPVVKKDAFLLKSKKPTHNTEWYMLSRLSAAQAPCPLTVKKNTNPLNLLFAVKPNPCIHN